MNVKEYFSMLILTELMIVALTQVPFLQTIITNSGFDSNQVWAGVGSIMLILYTGAYALTYRG